MKPATFVTVLCLCGVVSGNLHSQTRPTNVPAWDARGVGPLPRQGIACLDVSDDLSWIAVGTIATPGDPNVFLLDGTGQIVRREKVGERWIQQVAIDNAGK